MPQLNVRQNRSSLTRPHINRGFTFIELLVATAIISLSVAVYASMQVRALAKLQNLVWRNQALAISDDLAARIQGNRHPSLSGAKRWDNSSYWSRNLSAWQVQDCTDATKPCTPIAMMEYDIHAIRQWSASYLPQANISVAPCDLFYCIYIYWQTAKLNDCNTNDEHPKCVLLKIAR